MRLIRRLFLVPMANNDHGKSTIIRSFVSQGISRNLKTHQKGPRVMLTPWGQSIDAYIFGRSYQEVERRKFKTVEHALDGNDPQWRSRELIVMPSHIANQDLGDVREMIRLAHLNGFDAVGVAVILESSEASNRSEFPPFWELGWNTRWTIANPWSASPNDYLEAVGRDLWTWTAKKLTS